MESLRKRQFKFSTWYLLLGFVIMWAINAYFAEQRQPKRVPYSELVTLIDTGRVKEASVESDEIVRAKPSLVKRSPTTTRRAASWLRRRACRVSIRRRSSRRCAPAAS
jgi:ATP-dependent Zn protease